MRARGRGPRGRWCDSSHPDRRHRPEDGTRDYESRWLGFESSRWLSGCSSEAERVGDNHDVAGAIPAIQTKQILWLIPPFHGGTRFCEGRWLRFESSRWCSLTSPSGTALDSKSGEQCSIHWRRALPGSRSGPPCGVTAAGGISGLVTRRNFLRVAQQRGRSVRIRENVGASPAT